MKGAIFDGVVFKQGANFALAKFIEDATFTEAAFSGHAWFNKTLFAGEANFGDASFMRANFGGAKFEKNVDVLLALYKCVSGYGENYRRPLLWLLILWLYTSSSLLVGGLTKQTGNESLFLSFNSLPDWGWALLYGLETIFHLPTNDFAPEGLFGRIIHALASILGPVLIALFGLALRQRLKR